jgi:hypothetical protein
VRRIIDTLTSAVVLTATAVLVGVISAFYMVDSGTRLTTRAHGPWITWTTAGRLDADPYTRAHVTRTSLLPLTTSYATTYEASRDAEGTRLHSSCEHAIESDGLDAQWWSFTVFDDKGRLIQNPSDRHSFNSSTTVRDPDGGFTITLARSARPGNWLPTGGAGRLTVMFTVQDPKWAVASQDETGKPKVLPSIRTVGCR